VRRFTMVDDTALIRAILSRAKREGALVIYTVVDTDNRDCLEREAAKLGVEVLDPLGSFIVKVAGFLAEEPSGVPGKQHQIDASYYRRIEAIEFAVKHDDGQSPHTLHKADIVLVGLSRTSKTPLSSHLAQAGWRVANVPLYPGAAVPAEVLAVDQGKVYGLRIDPDVLVQVRRERLRHLGLPEDATYADHQRIVQEVNWCHAVYREHPQWPVIDVSGRAIEETAAKISQLHHLRLRARERPGGRSPDRS